MTSVTVTSSGHLEVCSSEGSTPIPIHPLHEQGRVRFSPKNNVSSDASIQLTLRRRWGNLSFVDQPRSNQIEVTLIRPSLQSTQVFKTDREGDEELVVGQKFRNDFSDVYYQKIEIYENFSLPESKAYRAPLEFNPIGNPAVKKHYECFICHSKQDEQAAIQLKNRLHESNIESWFDEDDLRTGEQYISEIAKAIHNIPLAIILIGPNGLGPFQDQEVQHLEFCSAANAKGVIVVEYNGGSLPEKFKHLSGGRKLVFLEWNIENMDSIAREIDKVLEQR